MITLLRTMTLKSVIGFGKYPDYRIDDFFKLNLTWELVNMYYNLQSISFTDDVLDALMITEERRIAKPGKSKHAYHEFKKAIYQDMKASQDDNQVMGLAMMRKKAEKESNLVRSFKEVSKQNNMNRVQRLGVKK